MVSNNHGYGFSGGLGHGSEQMRLRFHGEEGKLQGACAGRCGLRGNLGKIREKEKSDLLLSLIKN